MTRPSPFAASLALLALVGACVALVRHVQTGMPWVPREAEPVWLVEARVDFVATGDPVTVSLSLPEYLANFQTTDERAASPGYGFAIVESEGDRRAEWTRRSANGPQTLYFSTRLIPRDDASRDGAGASAGDEVAPAPESVFWNDSEQAAVSGLLRLARETSSDPVSLARELLKRLNDPRADQNAALLLAGSDDKVALFEGLLETAEVPARVVLALELEDARRRQSMTPMVELYDGARWVLINPETGASELPPGTVLWHRGGRSLLDVRGGRQSRVSFSMLRESVPSTLLAAERGRGSVFYEAGLHSLPIEEQGMFRMLLLLPVGALVVVFMRVLVGIETAGTFMPVLIALAFLQTSLLPGLVSFLSVLSIGLVMRGWLSRLNLLLVARIATLIVLVIFIISALSIVGYQLGYSTGMIVTFFPMIIIAWTIERMSVLWEEEGPRDVFVQGGGSLLVAVIAYSAMQADWVRYLSFQFPELHLAVLAAIMAMGRYTGYKLLELRRFRKVDDWT